MTDFSEAGSARPASTAWRVPERATFWLWQLAPFAVALVAYVTAFYVMSPGATGDEPHYLVAAQSVAYDGDLDLANDYASPERTLEVFGISPFGPDTHAADHRDTGQLRPVRGIGMSTLIAPAVALGGETGVRLLMTLIAALLADQLFRLLRDLGLRRKYAVLAWAAVALCYPMLAFSSQIYPEIPGALLIVVALRIMVSRASSPLALAFGSTAAALLFWLHVRFIPLSLGVLVGLVVAACLARRRGPPVPRAPGPTGSVRAAAGEVARGARVLTRDWRTVTVPVVVPYLGNVALFAAVSYHLYGSVSPAAGYRPYSDTTAGSGGWSFLYEYALADLLNPVQGWIPYVPVHWLGLAALGCLVLRWRWAALACIAVPVGYELVLASAGPDIGFGFPARYLIPVIPLVAVPLALAAQEVRWSRFVFYPLLAVSLLVSLAAVHEPAYLYPAGEKPRIFGLRSADEVFPRTNPVPSPISYVQRPGDVRPPIGRVEDDAVVAGPGDERGYLFAGPYSPLKPGSYRATYRLAVTGARPDDVVVGIDVTSTPPLRAIAGRTLTAAELAPGGRMTEVALDFSNANGGLVETRVYYNGFGTLRAGGIEVAPQSPVAPQTFGRFHDWPKALAWILATIVVGVLLVLGMRRAQARESSSAGSDAGAASTTN
jgi:hypothetical protein